MQGAMKALIITWIILGLALAGGVGYYFGKRAGEKTRENQIMQPGEMVQPGGMPGQEMQPEGEQWRQQPAGPQQRQLPKQP